MQREETTVYVTALGQTAAHRIELITDDSEQSIAALCTDLPGCGSLGNTRENALVNITDAIKDYLEVKEEIRLRKMKSVS
jgi:predicted RNase H-like HicB family nuclease